MQDYYRGRFDKKSWIDKHLFMVTIAVSGLFVGVPLVLVALVFSAFVSGYLGA